MMLNLWIKSSDSSLLTLKLYFHLDNVIEGSHCTARSMLVVLLAKLHYCLSKNLPLNLYCLMTIYSCCKLLCAYRTDTGKDSLIDFSVSDQLSCVLSNFTCFLFLLPVCKNTSLIIAIFMGEWSTNEILFTEVVLSICAVSLHMWMCYWQLTLCLFFVCAWCRIFHLQLKIWEKFLYLLVACNVMLSHKVVYKSTEKEEGGKIIPSNEHWKSTNKAYMSYKLEVWSAFTVLCCITLSGIPGMLQKIGLFVIRNKKCEFWQYVV